MLSPSLASSSSKGSGNANDPRNLSTSDASTLFTNILLPLIAQLLKPEIWHSDPSGMGDTRLQAALLTCKVFLRFLDTLLAGPLPQSPISPTKSIDTQSTTRNNHTPQNGTPTPTDDASSPAPAPTAVNDPTTPPGVTIFHRILDLLERLLKSGATPHTSGSSNTNNNIAASHEALEEAVPESVKNVLLVMDAGGYLERPNASGDTEQHGDEESRWKQDLWKGTEARLEKFLPGLLAEVFPPPTPPQAKEEDVAQQQEQQSQSQRANGDGVDEGGERAAVENPGQESDDASDDSVE